jgi:hypothetical protein
MNGEVKELAQAVTARSLNHSSLWRAMRKRIGRWIV